MDAVDPTDARVAGVDRDHIVAIQFHIVKRKLPGRVPCSRNQIAIEQAGRVRQGRGKAADILEDDDFRSCRNRDPFSFEGKPHGAGKRRKHLDRLSIAEASKSHDDIGLIAADDQRASETLKQCDEGWRCIIIYLFSWSGGRF